MVSVDLDNDALSVFGSASAELTRNAHTSPWLSHDSCCAVATAAVWCIWLVIMRALYNITAVCFVLSECRKLSRILQLVRQLSV